MKKEEEQKRSKSKRKVEDSKTSKDFTRDQSSSSNRIVLDRLESEDLYEPSWDYSSYPNKEYRRISTIREDSNESYDYLRFSFDLWPRRIPSDAIS